MMKIMCKVSVLKLLCHIADVPVNTEFIVINTEFIVIKDVSRIESIGDRKGMEIDAEKHGKIVIFVDSSNLCQRWSKHV